jgi:DNA topoisomerase-1
VDHNGRGVPARTKEWIEQLRNAPAWEDVWISLDPAAPLLATGRDIKNRKQYRYSTEWRAHRDDRKYRRIIEFGTTLGKIRRRALADLRLPGLSRRKVLGAIVRLLDRTAIRVGNEEYKKNNNSYGLATLQDDHVTIRGNTITFQFVGKRAKEHRGGGADPGARVTGLTPDEVKVLGCLKRRLSRDANTVSLRMAGGRKDRR